MNMLYVVYLPIYQVFIHQQRYTSTAVILLINSIFISLHQPPFPQPPGPWAITRTPTLATVCAHASPLPTS